MTISDYAHWNEDAQYVQWMDERYAEEPETDDDPDAGWDDEDEDEDTLTTELDAPAVEDWYREDLGWGGGFD